MNKTKSFWKIPIFVITLILIVGIFMIKGSKDKMQMNSTSSEINATPSPISNFPFREITIPYLREQKYESSLAALDEVSAGESYTSYLTNYDSQNLKIMGLLTKPAGQMPPQGWPAIIFIHGYIPPSQYQTLVQYSDYVDYLARNGFVVFKIDLRGHGNSMGEPSGAYYSADYIVDTLNAYAALQSTSFINDKAIGLWGHSMAGNVVMRSLAVKPDIPAAVIWAGAVYSYTDWRKYGISDSSYQPPQMSSTRVRKRQELLKMHGEPSNESKFWREVAPTTYLNDLKGAIQLNHAVDDVVVNIGYSRDLNRLLNGSSIPHELKEYSGGGHNISGSSFNQAMQNTLEFYNKYLK